MSSIKFTPGWLSFDDHPVSNNTFKASTKISDEYIKIDSEKLKEEISEDNNKFIELCGFRPSYSSDKYLSYLNTRDHPESEKYYNFWKKIYIIYTNKEHIEIDNYEDEYYSYDYDNSEYMDYDIENEPEMSDNFVEEFYDYRYTIDRYEDEEIYSSSEEEEFIDINYLSDEN